MADTKISALPASTTPLAGTEVLPIVQSSSTVQVSVANLTAGRAVATGALTVTGTLSATSSSTQEIATFAHPSTSTDANNGGAILQVKNTSNTNGNMQSLIFRNSNSSASSAIFGYNAIQSTGEGFITFGTRNSAGTFGERARIDSSGNLGIGTTLPSSKLEVGATNDVGISMSNSSSVTSGNRGSFSMNNSASSTVGLIRFGAVTDNVGTDIQFYTRPAAGSLTQTMTLDSSGNLLVGKTTSALGTAGIEIFGAGYGQFTANNDASLFANRLGSDGDTVKFYRATSQVGSISVTTSLTSYNTTSDYRLKTVVGAVTGAGQRIDALKPIDYLWTEGNVPARGFLAHEFQEVYASSVTGTKDAVDADGKPMYQAMQASTSEVIADLVAELQSLRARVAQLESKP